MRRFLTVSAVVAFAVCLSAAASADFSNSGVPGAQQGDVHVPWSPKYLPLLPNHPIQYGSSTSFGLGNGQTSYYFGSGWPAYGYGWGPNYGYSYGYYPPYYLGPVILPPLYLPAEEFYGPLAVLRFMGMDGLRRPALPVIIANQKVAEVDGRPARPKLRVSNAAMKAQAGKFMAFGDARFLKQNYNSALDRYRTAAQSASDLPETFVRQGFALVAMGRFDSAAKAMRRALLLQPDANKWNVRLADLYGENKIAKTAHLEALARAVEDNPQSADLLLLLGLQLLCDGQADRAMPVFQRCEQLGGNEDGAITGLLKPVGPIAVNKGRDM